MKKGLYALSPLILFIVFYLVTSIIIGDFYKIPITVAFLVSSIYALLTTKGSIEKRINIFSEGAGSKNMMYMLWIFLLAGAFASTAKSMGAVDATVNMTLRIVIMLTERAFRIIKIVRSPTFRAFYLCQPGRSLALLASVNQHFSSSLLPANIFRSQSRNPGYSAKDRQYPWLCRKMAAAEFRWSVSRPRRQRLPCCGYPIS